MFSQICEMFFPHVEFAGVCVYSQIYKMLRIWNSQMCCMYLLDFRMQNCEYARCFSNVEPANMRAVFSRMYAGCFGMWNCEYGYVFAKNLQEVFRMWNCEYRYVFAKNLQEVFECGIANIDMFSQKSTRSFRMWNCEYRYVFAKKSTRSFRMWNCVI